MNFYKDTKTKQFGIEKWKWSLEWHLTWRIKGYEHLILADFTGEQVDIGIDIESHYNLSFQLDSCIQ